VGDRRLTLTIYEGITIGPIQLEEKSGGRSGHWSRPRE
jgi:hypothetical protein